MYERLHSPVATCVEAVTVKQRSCPHGKQLKIQQKVKLVKNTEKVKRMYKAIICVNSQCQNPLIAHCPNPCNASSAVNHLLDVRYYLCSWVGDGVPVICS